MIVIVLTSMLKCEIPLIFQLNIKHPIFSDFLWNMTQFY